MSRHARVEAETIRAMTTAGASGAMWAALCALKLHADLEGCCFPSITTLGKIAGLERRTLTRALSALDKSRIISREKQAGRATHYRVLLGASSPLPLGASSPLPLGASSPLPLGASAAATRGDSDPRLGASSPPELQVLNREHEQTGPEQARPVTSVDTRPPLRDDPGPVISCWLKKIGRADGQDATEDERRMLTDFVNQYGADETELSIDLAKMQGGNVADLGYLRGVLTKRQRALAAARGSHRPLSARRAARGAS